MSFKYNPKDADNKLIPDGEYEAHVLEAEEMKSKAGNDMIKLTIKVWAHGDAFHLFDYVVNPSSLWKLKRLAGAVGMMDRFESGAFEPRDLIGKNCLAFVKTKKDESGKYPDQNVIMKYSPSTTPVVQERAPGEDDLAF